IFGERVQRHARQRRGLDRLLHAAGFLPQEVAGQTLRSIGAHLPALPIGHTLVTLDDVGLHDVAHRGRWTIGSGLGLFALLLNFAAGGTAGRIVTERALHNLVVGRAERRLSIAGPLTPAHQPYAAMVPLAVA